MKESLEAIVAERSKPQEQTSGQSPQLMESFENAREALHLIRDPDTDTQKKIVDDVNPYLQSLGD